MAAHEVLVVDDDVRIAEALARMIKKAAPVRVATSLAEARATLDAGASWAGFAVDVRLGDGSGFDVISAAAHRLPNAPLLVMSGDLAPTWVNRAAQLGATFLCKPFDGRALEPFLERVAVCARAQGANGSGRAAPLDAELARLAHRCHLSVREHEIIAFVAQGGERDTFLREHGIRLATFKSHVHHVLDKCGANSLDELVADVLRRALDAPRD